MRSVASGGLQRLREEGLFVPDERSAEGYALLGRPAKMRDAENRPGPRQLNDRIVQRDNALEAGRHTVDAVSAYHRRLDRVSLRQSLPQSARAVIGKIY